MSTYKIADFVVEMNNRHSYTDWLCADFSCDGETIDFSVSASDDEIAAEQALMGEEFSAGYCEATCLYRSLCNQILCKNAFLLHGAAVETQGRAVVFLGKSGAGKSTHALLWKHCFGDKVNIINGDKPIVRLIEGRFIAYGTPWSGKERLYVKTGVPIAAICFIEQSKENNIARLDISQAVMRYFHQLLIPKDKDSAAKLLELTDEFLKSVPAYLLHCDISKAAAELSYNFLSEVLI